MQDAANARLADPDDPGGAAGRAVIEVTIPANRGFRTRVAELLRDLVDAVRTDTAPPAEALGLVNLTTLPVYRVANTAAAYRGAVVDQEVDALAEAVALDILQVWISDLHRTVEERAGTLDIADGEQLRRWREGLNLAGAAAARWLALSPEERATTGLMAPSHKLREGINEIVRERLVRDGVVHGPAMASERLVSKGYTNAEKSLAANYAAGDVVAFHRPYKRLGVEKGDELRVAGVDREAHRVMLDGRDGQRVAWEPARLAAGSGGVEVYRNEAMELRAGDRIRWTRNDTGLGLVNSQTAEVAAVRGGAVTFRLEDGRMLDLNQGDAQLRHIDRAWASTVHAFQGRTVDTVIAAMEANHPNLTTQKTLYVEISRARDKAELVTDDKGALREQLEAATGERIAALEAVEPERAKGRDAGRDEDRSAGREKGASLLQERDRSPGPGMERGRGSKSSDRDMAL